LIITIGASISRAASPRSYSISSSTGCRLHRRPDPGLRRHHAAESGACRADSRRPWAFFERTPLMGNHATAANRLAAQLAGIDIDMMMRCRSRYRGDHIVGILRRDTPTS
jgi:hypothetical protein